MRSIWEKLSKGGRIDWYQFRSDFDSIVYKGNSQVKQTSKGTKSTLKTQTSSTAQWENDIIEKLRSILHTSTKSL